MLQALADRPIRFGAYGNPDKIPLHLLREIAHSSKQGWTGYTHNWRECAPGYQKYLMASVDSPEEAKEAQAMGWRTFRVAANASDIAENEFRCPASIEATHARNERAKAQGLPEPQAIHCADCMLCSGTSVAAKNVVIADHGAGSVVGNENRARKAQTLQQLTLLKRD